MSQTYTVNNEDSKIKFVIKNLGLTVNGTFSGAKGNVIFDVNDLKSSEINIVVNSNSVNTDNEARDQHLRKNDYFDVIDYPLISFKSTKIEASSRYNRYNVEGNLTIKGITKVIKFELIALHNAVLDLRCNFEVNRRHFKVGGSSMVLSDIVKMNLHITANKKTL